MQKIASAFLISLLLIGNSFAGLRGPGEYYGVVIFDRWDTCYVYSGVYLMCVSESTKNRLRRYRNRCMRINALEVNQPINPGDGRIGKYKILGPAKTKRDYIQVDGLKLVVTPNFTDDGLPEFKIEIKNESGREIKIHSNELAVTMFRKKTEKWRPLEPSDGPSYAMMTRESFRDSTWQGMSNDLDEQGAWTIGQENALPDWIALEPGQSKVIPITFHLPAGEYDFLCGYGGGVHGDKSIASNQIGFDVNDRGRTTLVNTAVNDPHQARLLKLRPAKLQTGNRKPVPQLKTEN